MTKAKKSARKAARNPINWTKLFTLVRKGLSNAEIAKAMGVKLDPKSPDSLKPVRAMVSRAKTVGVRIDGKMCRLHVPKDRNRSDAEPKARKVAKPAKQKPARKAEPTTVAATA